MTIWQTIKKNPGVLVWAIIIHLLAFVAIAVSFKSSDPKISAVKQEKVIEAVAIDEKKINEEINKLKKADKRKKSDQKRLEEKTQQAKKERRKEEQKLQALKKEQEQQQSLNKKKQRLENKRLAESVKKREQQERQQKEAEKKQQETELKQQETERKQQETLKKLTELEKKRQEKEAQLERKEKERLEKIAQIKRDEELAKREQLEKNEVEKYRVLIDEKVSRNWIYLDSYGKGLVCVIQIKLLPSGDVVDATIIQTSGDSAFDRSAELAARKASPLPVPTNDTDLFQREFRTVNLLFKPNY